MIYDEYGIHSGSRNNSTHILYHRKFKEKCEAIERLINYNKLYESFNFVYPKYNFGKYGRDVSEVESMSDVEFLKKKEYIIENCFIERKFYYDLYLSRLFIFEYLQELNRLFNKILINEFDYFFKCKMKHEEIYKILSIKLKELINEYYSPEFHIKRFTVQLLKYTNCQLYDEIKELLRKKLNLDESYDLDRWIYDGWTLRFDANSSDRLLIHIDGITHEKGLCLSEDTIPSIFPNKKVAIINKYYNYSIDLLGYDFECFDGYVTNDFCLILDDSVYDNLKYSSEIVKEKYS